MYIASMHYSHLTQGTLSDEDSPYCEKPPVVVALGVPCISTIADKSMMIVSKRNGHNS